MRRYGYTGPGVTLGKRSSRYSRIDRSIPFSYPNVSFVRSADLLGRMPSRFTLALAASLLLHAVVLSLKLAAPASPAHDAPGQPGRRIDATLAAPRKPAPPVARPTPKAERPPYVLAVPRRPHAPKAESDVDAKSWSRAERDEMRQFLDELAEEAKTPSGTELAQRALAMARTLRPPPSADGDESAAIMRRLATAEVEPFSLEMYFNALFAKMNRSAAMLGNSPRAKGVKAAALRIRLNQDGSVKSFEILHAADQQAEIAFVRAVVDMAAPFPSFPSDIRRATDALVLQICIRPNLWGTGGGPAFTRMGEGEACR